MTVMEVRASDLTAQELFFRLPYHVYKDDPVWVPENKAAMNIFPDSAAEVKRIPLLALSGGKAVARLLCTVHPASYGDDGRRQGWIGFFEALPGHEELVGELLHRAEMALTALGAASVVAPKTDNHAMGFVSKGFHLPQTVLTMHNPPYYPRLFTGAGYSLRNRAISFYFRRRNFHPPQIKLPAIRTREFNRNNLALEIKHFNRLQNAIFANRAGYIPRTLPEDEQLIQSFLPHLDDDLIIFAENECGEPVGILLCLPDVNQLKKEPRITRTRIISIGVIPGWEGKGAGKAMGYHLMQNLLRKTKYEEVEASWIQSDNIPPQILALKFGAKQGRQFTLLEKTLAV